MATSIDLSLTVVNNVSGGEVEHFIFYHESPNSKPNADVLVWHTLNVQTGTRKSFPVAFDTEYTASVFHDDDAIETSQSISANNGEELIVTKHVKSDAPILRKGLTTNPFATYVTVRNEYEGIKSVIVQAEKNDKPLVQQTLIELHDCAQFQIGSFIHMAWNSDLKEGNFFKRETYSRSSQKIDLIDPKTKLPATNIIVTVTNNENGIEMEIDYPSSN